MSINSSDTMRSALIKAGLKTAEQIEAADKRALEEQERKERVKKDEWELSIVSKFEFSLKSGVLPNQHLLKLSESLVPSRRLYCMSLLGQLGPAIVEKLPVDTISCPKCGTPGVAIIHCFPVRDRLQKKWEAENKNWLLSLDFELEWVEESKKTYGNIILGLRCTSCPKILQT